MELTFSCRVFRQSTVCAFANATAVCFDEQPTKVVFSRGQMRNHLLNALRRNTCLFPKRKYMKHYVKLYSYGLKFIDNNNCYIIKIILVCIISFFI